MVYDFESQAHRFISPKSHAYPITTSTFYCIRIHLFHLTKEREKDYKQLFQRFNSLFKQALVIVKLTMKQSIQLKYREFKEKSK